MLLPNSGELEGGEGGGEGGRATGAVSAVVVFVTAGGAVAVAGTVAVAGDGGRVVGWERMAARRFTSCHPNIANGVHVTNSFAGLSVKGMEL